MIVKEEKVNLGRQNEIDIVKALAIVFMVVVHVYEELSPVNYEILPNTFVDNVIQFLGGPLAAPIFMFSLGVGLSYSSHRSPKEFIKRGISLIVLSYSFNLIRFAIPYLIASLSIGYDPTVFIYEIFQIDILTFAGMAFLVTGILKKLNMPVWGVVAVAIIFQAIGNWAGANVEFTSKLSIYAHGVLVCSGQPSYFPLFLWYIYPALGLLFAKYLRHIEDTDQLYLGIFTISASILLTLCIALSTLGFDVRMLYTVAFDSFYCQNILYVLFSLCCIGIEVSLVHFVLKIFKISKTSGLVRFMSGKLNEIYMVQWLIIGWTEILIFNFEDLLPTVWVIPVGLLILAVAMFIVAFIDRIRSKKK